MTHCKHKEQIREELGITGNQIKLTPCSRVLLEKLTVTQVVKKFTAFYGIQRFITVFTRSHHWTLT